MIVSASFVLGTQHSDLYSCICWNQNSLLFLSDFVIHLTLGLVCPVFWVATATVFPCCPLLAFWPPRFLSTEFSLQDLVLLAHGPHTDLFVDHIDSWKTVETERLNTSLYRSMNRVHPGAGVCFLSAVWWWQSRNINFLYFSLLCPDSNNYKETTA